VSVLTTLERRFNLQSADVGVIASSFEIGNLALILFVSYFGAKANRPRLIGCGGIVMALGALLSALPEFLASQYKITDTWSKDLGRDVCSNTSKADEPCGNRANTNMMYLLLIGAQVLLGIGATPVQPLGVSYIDDHVQKKDSSLYIVVRVTRTRQISCSQKTRNTSHSGTGSNSYQSTKISKSQRKWAM
ncbi:solute carrier organic anion transporter family member 3A1-like, partial [Sinocyclocheilus grahami]|uniref:solute carrier organic anion transporter family member 3A1-like n=1 Tax=Sinocyclocheilus grahami TaxID=75366 RepID=UPI0007AD670F